MRRGLNECVAPSIESAPIGVLPQTRVAAGARRRPTVHDEAQMPFGLVKGHGIGRLGGKAGLSTIGLSTTR